MKNEPKSAMRVFYFFRSTVFLYSVIALFATSCSQSIPNSSPQQITSTPIRILTITSSSTSPTPLSTPTLRPKVTPIEPSTSLNIFLGTWQGDVTTDDGNTYTEVAIVESQCPTGIICVTFPRIAYEEQFDNPEFVNIPIDEGKSNDNTICFSIPGYTGCFVLQANGALRYGFSDPYSGRGGSGFLSKLSSGYNPTPIPTATRSALYDNYSLDATLGYLVNLIETGQPELIKNMVGKLGTYLGAKYGTEFVLLEKNNEAEVASWMSVALSNSHPQCFGYDHCPTCSKAVIHFQGLSCGDTLCQFIFLRQDAGWELVAIGSEPLDGIRNLQMERCPGTVNPAPLFQPNPNAERCPPDSDYVSDITVPDNTRIPAGDRFSKTWRLLNSGTCDWSNDYQLVFISGDQMNGPASIKLKQIVHPGETLDITVDLVSPQTPGTYKGQWQLATPNGELFGTKPYVQIVVP